MAGEATQTLVRLPRMQVMLPLTHEPFASLVVVLFAWIGAQDKYLLKYDLAWREAAHLAGHSVVVLRLIAPTWLSFDASVRDVLLTPHDSLLLDLQHVLGGHATSDPSLATALATCPIALQFFSNGGAYAYEALSLLRSAHPWTSRVMCSVFDSSPVNILPRAVRLVLANTLGTVGGAVALSLHELLQRIKATPLPPAVLTLSQYNLTRSLHLHN